MITLYLLSRLGKDHNTFCLAYKENFEPTEINFSSFRFFINDYNCAGC